jgi:hypothetical protein
MVPDPNLDRALCGGADQLLESLEQFQPERWGLPPFPPAPAEDATEAAAAGGS